MGRSKINIALFGLGRIGLMHGKNLMRNKVFNLRYVFDLNKKLTQKVSKILKSKPINNPLEALKDILSDIDSKVIIWARFRADISLIESMLGELAVSYHGGISNDQRASSVERFQNDPKVRYFIGQPQSGGIGLTLTAADYAIYYSNSFDLETRLQSEDRCHRIGTKNNITYIDIEAPKTIDTKIIKALRDKKSLADIVTKDPISMFLSDDGDDI